MAGITTVRKWSQHIRYSNSPVFLSKTTWCKRKSFVDPRNSDRIQGLFKKSGFGPNLFMTKNWKKFTG
jgi:hypothetical protein